MSFQHMLAEWREHFRLLGDVFEDETNPLSACVCRNREKIVWISILPRGFCCALITRNAVEGLDYYIVDNAKTKQNTLSITHFLASCKC